MPVSRFRAEGRPVPARRPVIDPAHESGARTIKRASIKYAFVARASAGSAACARPLSPTASCRAPCRSITARENRRHLHDLNGFQCIALDFTNQVLSQRTSTVSSRGQSLHNFTRPRSAVRNPRRDVPIKRNPLAVSDCRITRMLHRCVPYENKNTDNFSCHSISLLFASHSREQLFKKNKTKTQSLIKLVIACC